MAVLYIVYIYITIVYIYTCVLRKYITIINYIYIRLYRYIYIMYISMYTYIMDTPSADPMLRCFYGFCRISAVIEKHQHPSFHWYEFRQEGIDWHRYCRAIITSRHKYQTSYLQIHIHFSIANLETSGKCSTIVSWNCHRRQFQRPSWTCS